MIPLRDSQATRRLTPANTLLILVNIAVFALEVKLGGHANVLLARYAMVPARITHLRLAPGRAVESLATVFTATFLHAGFLHIAGNMLYLFIFGPAVEERMGTPRYLFFYLAAAAFDLCGCALGGGDPFLFAAASGADPETEPTITEFALSGRPAPSD